jgi:hypothetical protein
LETNNGQPLEPETPEAIATEERRKENLRRVMDAMSDCTVKEAMELCINIAGQLCASVSEGKPSLIKANATNIAEQIRIAAINKIFHDDDQKRGSNVRRDVN